MIQSYYPHQFYRQFGYSQDLLGGLLEIFCTGTLKTVYQHWESCTRLGTYSKITIPDYHSLEEFLVIKAYANWWIKMRNPDKEILTVACIESPPDSSQ